MQEQAQPEASAPCVITCAFTVHAHSVSTQHSPTGLLCARSWAAGGESTNGRTGSLLESPSEPRGEAHEQKQWQCVLISKRMRRHST